MQGLLAVSGRAAQGDEAFVDEPIHEGRVFIPGVLAPDRECGVPAWAVHQPDGEIGHNTDRTGRR